jgi:carboxylesterase type B
MQTPTSQTLSEVAARYPPSPHDPGSPFNNFAIDIGFACYSRTLSKAWKENAYRYVMSLPPATHALAQGYYFYVDDILTPGQIDVNIARQFQRYLRNFILFGNPNDEMDHPQDATWPNYDEVQIFNITATDSSPLPTRGA